MSLAPRLPWLDAFSTAVVVAVAIFIATPDGSAAGDLAGVALRGAFIVMLCVAAFYYNDLYDFDEAAHDAGQLFVRLCRALGVAALVLGAMYAAFPALVVSGRVVSHALLLALAAVLATHLTVYTLAKRAPLTERVLIMGAGPLARDLAEQIRTRRDVPLMLIGVVGEPGTAEPYLGECADVDAVVRRHRPHRIIVALRDRRGNLPVMNLVAARLMGVRVEEGTHAWERLTRRLAVESLTPSALVFGDGFRRSPIRQGLQRVLAVVTALVGLVVAAPVMAVIALLIRLDSAGPVLFVQERIGLGGRPFRVFKFRTMRPAEARDEAIWGRDNASRVTRVGRVLRKYRLDELPQFWNILRGDMNLVGPRPEMAGNVATFSAVIPFYQLRHEVRPGLTGWAQIKAGYSMTTEEVTRKLCYDLYYVKHLSLAFDVAIIIDTVKFVLSGKRPG